MKKRLLAIIITLITILSAVWVLGCSKEDLIKPTNDFAYELSADGSYYIVAGIGSYSGTTLVIPDTYNEKPIKEIKNMAFFWNKKTVSVVLGKNVINIGSDAFVYCESLIGATFMDTAKERR